MIKIGICFYLFILLYGRLKYFTSSHEENPGSRDIFNTLMKTLYVCYAIFERDFLKLRIYPGTMQKFK